MKPGTGVFGKLTDLYRRMGEAYATTAKAAGLSCDDCPHNCCTSYFQHHTYIEWIYLHKGLNALPEQRRKEYASRAEAYLAEAREALAAGILEQMPDEGRLPGAEEAGDDRARHLAERGVLGSVH